jgi:uncharacterized protein (TIGR02996 family)
MVAALLDTLRTTPDDDELRLVFADALEEAGEVARADLIRTQIAVARNQADAVIRARAIALQADRDRALGGLVQRWQSRAGLVWHVEARTDEWLAHGASLFDTEPITSITVADPRDELDDDFELGDLVTRLAQQAWLAHVHAIEIPAYCALAEPAAVIDLLGSPHLQRLTQLTVPHPQTAIAAARHGALPQLRALRIHCEGAPEGDDAIRAFATHRLTHLDLVGCGLTADGMRAIVAAGWSLVRLVCAGTHYVDDDLGEPGVRALAEAPALASLQELVLESAGLDDAALRALAGSPHLRSLQMLSIYGNPAITDDGIVMLADSAVIASLRWLNVTATSITDVGLATLPDHVEVVRG